eukprot:2271843-Rhodomonas_salina.1
MDSAQTQIVDRHRQEGDMESTQRHGRCKGTAPRGSTSPAQTARAGRTRTLTGTVAARGSAASDSDRPQHCHTHNPRLPHSPPSTRCCSTVLASPPCALPISSSALSSLASLQPPLPPVLS